MKHTITSLLSLLLVVVIVFALGACSAPTENPDATESTTATAVEETGSIEKAGLWATATYLTDKEFGTGAKTVVVKVEAADQAVTFTVHTDAETVGAALQEHDLLQGEEGAYGLYVKVVNGITADYDVDQSYWAFYLGDEYAMTGVDTTNITEGTVYRLVYTK